MKHFIITAVLLATANSAVANTEICSALAGLSESIYVARYQGVEEKNLLHNLIEATNQGELENLRIAAFTVKEIYDMSTSKLYRGGEAQLGSAVFESCMKKSSI